MLLFIVLYTLFSTLTYAGWVYVATRIDQDDVDLCYALRILILSIYPVFNVASLCAVTGMIWKHHRHKFPRWTFNPIIFHRKIK